MRRIVLLLPALLAAGPADAESINLTAEPVALESSSPDLLRIGQLEFWAGFELTSEDDKWGGLSGASITADGTTLTVVADVGRWYRLKLRHDRAGRLIDVAGGKSGRLRNEDGNPLSGRGSRDAEAIARAPDGSYYVAFEGWVRLWRYKPTSDPLRAAATNIRPPTGMKSLPHNEGVEAAAVLPSGKLLLLSEGGRTDDGDVRGWLGDGKRWSNVTLAPTGSFKPTDLAVLPGGDVLLLERRVSILGGFSARLSVIPAKAIAPKARLVSREIGTIESPWPVDNFEAVAARPAPDGSVLIYVLSDDNFSALERTLLLQLRWRPQ